MGGVTENSIGATLRERRLAAGMTQRELAERSGVPQPNIAAYESARRVPEPQTRERLFAALSVPTLARISAARDEILSIAQHRRLSDVRVFGSVARRTSSVGSDVDLLVHPHSDATIFDLAGFMAEVEELLGVSVDVVSDRGTGPTLERIRAEAIAL
jgi:predicted nucleotidyltransferase